MKRRDKIDKIVARNAKLLSEGTRANKDFLGESEINELDYQDLYHKMDGVGDQSEKVDDIPAWINQGYIDNWVEQAQNKLGQPGFTQEYLNKVLMVKKIFVKKENGEELTDQEKKIFRYIKSSKKSQSSRIQNLSYDKLAKQYIENFKSPLEHLVGQTFDGVIATRPDGGGDLIKKPTPTKVVDAGQLKRHDHTIGFYMTFSVILNNYKMNLRIFNDGSMGLYTSDNKGINQRFWVSSDTELVKSSVEIIRKAYAEVTQKGGGVSESLTPEMLTLLESYFQEEEKPEFVSAMMQYLVSGDIEISKRVFKDKGLMVYVDFNEYTLEFCINYDLYSWKTGKTHDMGDFLLNLKEFNVFDSNGKVVWRDTDNSIEQIFNRELKDKFLEMFGSDITKHLELQRYEYDQMLDRDERRSFEPDPWEDDAWKGKYDHVRPKVYENKQRELNLLSEATSTMFQKLCNLTPIMESNRKYDEVDAAMAKLGIALTSHGTATHGVSVDGNVRIFRPSYDQAQMVGQKLSSVIQDKEIKIVELQQNINI